MFFSQLSTLSEEFSDKILTLIDSYFTSLTPSARKLITISKLSDAIQINYQTTADVLRRGVEIGLLKKGFGVRCSECGTLFAEVDSLPDLLCVPSYCSTCEKVIDMDGIDYQYDIILLFSLNCAVPPFSKGQQDSPSVLNAPEGTVVHEDSLGSGVRYRLVTYDDLFSISTEKYEELKKLLMQVKQAHINTTEHGASLEFFIYNLFLQCIMFRATTKHRTQINQIDIMIRVKGLIDCALFSRLGNSFYIECKNEKNTPSIDHLLKFRSLLHDAGMRFGIFISRQKEPRTYRENINHIFLKDDIVIVCFYLEEIERLLNKRENLLECLDKKITEVTTNPLHSLGKDCLHLFDA